MTPEEALARAVANNRRHIAEQRADSDTLTHQELRHLRFACIAPVRAHGDLGAEVGIYAAAISAQTWMAQEHPLEAVPAVHVGTMIVLWAGELGDIAWRKAANDPMFAPHCVECGTTGERYAHVMFRTGAALLVRDLVTLGAETIDPDRLMSIAEATVLNLMLEGPR